VVAGVVAGGLVSSLDRRLAVRYLFMDVLGLGDMIAAESGLGLLFSVVGSSPVLSFSARGGFPACSRWARGRAT
jgi:hypothetical protein